MFQGFPRSRPRRSPLLQSVSRIPAPAAPPGPAFAKCFKDPRHQALPAPAAPPGALLCSLQQKVSPRFPRTIPRPGRPRGSAEARFCRVFQGFPRSRPRRCPLLQIVSRLPAVTAVARVCKACQGFSRSRPHRVLPMQSVSRSPAVMAVARLCKAGQGFPRSRPRRGPLLQSVSRIPAVTAPPRPAFAECFKDSRGHGPAESC